MKKEATRSNFNYLLEVINYTSATLSSLTVNKDLNKDMVHLQVLKNDSYFEFLQKELRKYDFDMVAFYNDYTTEVICSVYSKYNTNSEYASIVTEEIVTEEVVTEEVVTEEVTTEEVTTEEVTTEEVTTEEVTTEEVTTEEVSDYTKATEEVKEAAEELFEVICYKTVTLINRIFKKHFK